MVQDKTQFNHTKTTFSKKFARLGCAEFVNKVMQEKRKLNTTSQSPVHSSLSPGSRSASTPQYNFSEGSSNDPDGPPTEDDHDENRYYFLKLH